MNPLPSPRAIALGMLGLGVVGSSVAQVLREKGELLAQRAGAPLILKKALVRDLCKPRPISLSTETLTTDPAVILEDPEIAIVIEVMGGEEPALSYIRRALEQGKYVVTANKEVIAKHGATLLALAHQHGGDILYEASAGGGIPLINPLRESLLANKVTAIRAIINGTTNYILSTMAKGGVDFGTALREAQELGYAEPDPVNDVEGTDAAYKLAILATLAFGTEVRPQDIYCEGITRLTPRDFRYAKELGYNIKLLAIAKDAEGALQVRVHPVLLHEDALLAKVDGVHNAIQIQGDLVGEVLFYGRGAGAQPTSSAVIADVVELARRISLGITDSPRLVPNLAKPLRAMAEIITRYYIRMSVADRPGVLAQIARILGDYQISIASVIQKEVDESAQTAEIVIMTHPAREAAVQQALKEVQALGVVSDIGNFLRIED